MLIKKNDGGTTIPGYVQLSINNGNVIVITEGSGTTYIEGGTGSTLVFLTGYTDTQVSSAITYLSGYTDTQVSSAITYLSGYTHTTINSAITYLSGYTDTLIASAVTYSKEYSENYADTIYINAVLYATGYTNIQVLSAITYLQEYTSESTATNKVWYITDISGTTSGITLQGAGSDIHWLTGGTNTIYDVTQGNILWGSTGVTVSDMTVIGSDVIVTFDAANYATLSGMGIASGDTIRPNYFYNLGIPHNLGTKYPMIFVYDTDTDYIVYPTNNYFCEIIGAQNTNTTVFLDDGTGLNYAAGYKIIFKK
jgi:hypothetical protein